MREEVLAGLLPQVAPFANGESFFKALKDQVYCDGIHFSVQAIARLSERLPQNDPLIARFAKTILLLGDAELGFVFDRFDWLSHARVLLSGYAVLPLVSLWAQIRVLLAGERDPACMLFPLHVDLVRHIVRMRLLSAVPASMHSNHPWTGIIHAIHPSQHSM